MLNLGVLLLVFSVIALFYLVQQKLSSRKTKAYLTNIERFDIALQGKAKKHVYLPGNMNTDMRQFIKKLLKNIVVPKLKSPNKSFHEIGHVEIEIDSQNNVQYHIDFFTIEKNNIKTKIKTEFVMDKDFNFTVNFIHQVNSRTFGEPDQRVSIDGGKMKDSNPQPMKITELHTKSDLENSLELEKERNAKANGKNYSFNSYFPIENIKFSWNKNGVHDESHLPNDRTINNHVVAYYELPRVMCLKNR